MRREVARTRGRRRECHSNRMRRLRDTNYTSPSSQFTRIGPCGNHAPPRRLDLAKMRALQLGDRAPPRLPGDNGASRWLGPKVQFGRKRNRYLWETREKLRSGRVACAGARGVSCDVLDSLRFSPRAPGAKRLRAAQPSAKRQATMPDPPRDPRVLMAQATPPVSGGCAPWPAAPVEVAPPVVGPPPVVGELLPPVPPGLPSIGTQ
jgi:hypothetical protein